MSGHPTHAAHARRPARTGDGVDRTRAQMTGPVRRVRTVLEPLAGWPRPGYLLPFGGLPEDTEFPFGSGNRPLSESSIDARTTEPIPRSTTAQMWQ